jgi:hypothetical protein
MKALLLSALLLSPFLNGASKDIEKQRLELAAQQENDNMKIKIATIAAVVTVILIYFGGKGGGESAATFDTMMLDILKK